MPTGTIVMIVCVVLYGLIVVLFKDDEVAIEKNDFIRDDPTLGFDGSLGSCGLCADDFDTPPPK